MSAAHAGEPSGPPSAPAGSPSHGHARWMLTLVFRMLGLKVTDPLGRLRTLGRGVQAGEELRELRTVSRRLPQVPAQ